MSTLLMLGNTNETTFANTIAMANLKAKELFGSALSDIYVVHSRESSNRLATRDGWRSHIRAHGVSPDILTQTVIEVVGTGDEEAVQRFGRYVEGAFTGTKQGRIIIDLTNGTTLQKNLLSTVAYILDIPHVYAIDVAKLSQLTQPLGFLPPTQLQHAYIKAPDPVILDSLAHLSLTEVSRYQRAAAAHTKNYEAIDPDAADPMLFRDNLIHSIQAKLRGDREHDKALYRIASSSLATSTEELLRLLMRASMPSAKSRVTLGERLQLIRERIEETAPDDFDHEFFRRFNEFILYLRNSTVHVGKPLTALERFKADLSVKMAFPFFSFYLDIVTPILTAAGRPSVTPVRIATLDASHAASEFLVGLDGDDTGSRLEDLFYSATDEGTFRKLSQTVDRARDAIVKEIRKSDSRNAIVFATGDDILFRGIASRSWLAELQALYQRETGGLTCSIGYGRTFKEVYVALKLAKAQPGKASIVEVELS